MILTMAALYGFAYHRHAIAFLRSLKDAKLRRQIVKKINALAKDPLPRGCAPVKDVEDGGDPVYRIKQGKHRILYVVRDLSIVILDIDHRKDIYRGEGR